MLSSGCDYKKGQGYLDSKEWDRSMLEWRRVGELDEIIDFLRSPKIVWPCEVPAMNKHEEFYYRFLPWRKPKENEPEFYYPTVMDLETKIIRHMRENMDLWDREAGELAKIVSCIAKEHYKKEIADRDKLSIGFALWSFILMWIIVYLIPK